MAEMHFALAFHFYGAEERIGFAAAPGIDAGEETFCILRVSVARPLDLVTIGKTEAAHVYWTLSLLRNVTRCVCRCYAVLISAFCLTQINSWPCNERNPLITLHFTPHC